MSFTPGDKIRIIKSNNKDNARYEGCLGTIKETVKDGKSTVYLVEVDDLEEHGTMLAKAVKLVD